MLQRGPPLRTFAAAAKKVIGEVTHRWAKPPITPLSGMSAVSRVAYRGSEIP